MILEFIKLFVYNVLYTINANGKYTYYRFNVYTRFFKDRVNARRLVGIFKFVF